MMSKPYPNRNVKVIGSWLFFLLFVILSSLLLADEIKTQFELTTPGKIFAGQEASLRFTALKEDETLDSTMDGTYLLKASTFGDTVSKELVVKKGKVAFKLTLSKTATYIITLKSKSDSKLVVYSGHLIIKKAEAVQ